MAEGTHRPSWVEVDLDAIAHNAAVLAAVAAPAALCAVVKADAYGHGAVAVARAALAGGASSLAVAIEDEGVELREAGIEAPILILAEPAAGAMAETFRFALTPTIYTSEGLALAQKGAAEALLAGPAPVEIKVDTGMHRVGARPDDVPELAAAVLEDPGLQLAGLWTHLAVADEPENDFTAEQLRRFSAVRQSLASSGLGHVGRVHAANTAGALAWPAARLDTVRCGIGLYGYCPSPALSGILGSAVAAAGCTEGLKPALSWVSQVALVRELDGGERVSYGLLRPLAEQSVVTTVPLGYADGIPRSFFTCGGEVLIGGVRRPLAGTVTMDQIVVDCGPDRTIAKGDDVVLIGCQGEQSITADDWASLLGTINYEVITRIGPRVPRQYRGAGTPAR